MVCCQLSCMYQDFLAAFKNTYKNILVFFAERQTFPTKKFTCVLVSAYPAGTQSFCGNLCKKSLSVKISTITCLEFENKPQTFFGQNPASVLDPGPLFQPPNKSTPFKNMVLISVSFSAQINLDSIIGAIVQIKLKYYYLSYY